MPDDKPYGAFSHWYAAPTSNAEGTFVTVEHYMMFRKALLFKDSASAQKILASSNPQQAKAAGREVQDFDSHIWKQHRDRIVYEGNLMKFSQNPNLAALLLETGDRPLVEASPEDSLWGIGFSADNAASNRASWGENLCGKAIAHVRTTLRKA